MRGTTYDQYSRYISRFHEMEFMQYAEFSSNGLITHQLTQQTEWTPAPPSDGAICPDVCGRRQIAEVAVACPGAEAPIRCWAC